MKKSVKIVILVTVTLVFSCILVLAAILSPWVNLFFGVLLSPSPGRPEITYGEFPCQIVCEINGEIRTIKDVVVCEFDGYELLGTAGKQRVWKSKLKSGKTRLVLLRVEEEDLTYEITTMTGLAEYYMGDFSYGQKKEDYERVMFDERYLGYVQWKDGIQTGTSITREEAWEKYQFKIINKEYAQPIENSFR